MTEILRVQNLAKRYRHIRVLHDLSLSIHAGEFVGLIGPNGAGKSTTMRCIAAQLAPDAGSITILGHDTLQDPIGARRHLGYVPQDLGLYDHLTGQELLHFVADVREVPPDLQASRIPKLLDQLDLTAAKDRLAREYSGGMARKLAIAAAILAQPPLLLLDESFVGLDPESTFALRHILADYCAQGGAVLLSSHILDMVERVCSRVILLHHGAILRDLDRNALQKTLPHEYPTLTDLYMDLTQRQKSPTP